MYWFLNRWLNLTFIHEYFHFLGHLWVFISIIVSPNFHNSRWISYINFIPFFVILKMREREKDGQIERRKCCKICIARDVINALYILETNVEQKKKIESLHGIFAWCINPSLETQWFYQHFSWTNHLSWSQDIRPRCHTLFSSRPDLWCEYCPNPD